MKKRITFGFVFLALLCGQLFAFDANALKGTLEDLSRGVSQTAYTLQERESTSEREAYDTAVALTEKSERELAKMISGIEKAEEIDSALETLKTFAAGDPLKAHSGAVALKMLKDRAVFLNISGSKFDFELMNASTEVGKTDLKMAEKAGDLLSRNQKRLIVIQLPVIEAVLSLDDNKENRRIDSINGIFRRHGIRVISSKVDETGEKPQTNFYVSGKKFVLEALMRNFKGSTVSSDLKAVMVLTTGGFWGKSSIEVSVSPKSNAPETGSLAWYQAVLEKDPFKYMAENDYSKLTQLGKVEDVGGEKKLRLKNARLDLLVIPANGTRRDAIYGNSVEFGDVYVAAR